VSYPVQQELTEEVVHAGRRRAVIGPCLPRVVRSSLRSAWQPDAVRPGAATTPVLPCREHRFWCVIRARCGAEGEEAIPQRVQWSVDRWLGFEGMGDW